MDLQEYRKRAHELVDLIADYFESVNERHVLPIVQPGFLKDLIPADPPQDGESFEEIKKDFVEKILPNVTHWQSGKFFAYFPSAASYPSLLGDMLADMLSGTTFSWYANPPGTELETISVDWLGKLMNLPEGFLSHTAGGGCIQTSSSDAVLVAMIAAREKYLREKNIEDLSIISKFVVYGSEMAHSCVEKAAKILRIRFKSLPCDDSLALTNETFKSHYDQDLESGLIPIMVIATLGTTVAGSVDDIEGLGQICREKNLWFHVDAAYAGAFLICPEYRYLGKGLEFVNSINISAHKMLMIHFDCAVLWVQNRMDLIDALAVLPSYLKNRYSDKGSVIDYHHWQIQLGRRFRSLKLWCTLRTFGAKGLQDHLRKSVALAQHFASLVAAHDAFIVHQCKLSVVCFSLKSQSQDINYVNYLNEKFLKIINSSGMFLIGSKLKSQFVLRVAIGNHRTDLNIVNELWRLIALCA